MTSNSPSSIDVAVATHTPLCSFAGSVPEHAANWMRGLLLVSIVACLLVASRSLAQSESPAAYTELPSETPAKFEPTNDGFDHIKRDVMIPMRDGVKLHTVILIPKDATNAPMLLTRTPYEASKLTSHAESPHLGPVLQGYDNPVEVIVEGGYIRVVQDVRGKYGSEGDYVMNRPLRGPQNPTPVDHATDTWDTIEWLVKNVPESNGRVGILGISYDGFLPLMALVDPHPALKVSVPMNPMVDGWIGDDWFHNGAFRQLMMPYIYNQQATRKSELKWWTSHFDAYDTYLQAGSAGELGRRRGLEQLGFWRKILAHPTYDAFWRDQAVDKLLAAQPLKVPVMLVHSLWDQEDIYGAPAVYQAIEPKDVGNDKVFLVMGPWCHGQPIRDGSSLGALKFHTDTALYFRREILRPFLDQYLKEGAPSADVAPVTAFETGTNAWRRLPAWPAGGERDSSIHSVPLYLRAGLKLGCDPPAAGDEPYAEYTSDPAKPVPFRARPIRGFGDDPTWSQWLVDDQREASGRPDVVVFTSEVLTTPLKVSGQPIANLVASTSGTDADWVVKLIDVYPDEVAGQPSLGGYQLMVSADIFRGRYRQSLETPEPITSNEPLLYRFALPTANHVFLPGHRIMVQIQSSWFPLYDRNPQTFVPSIFWAQPDDYRKVVQRVHHSPDHASFIEIPWVNARQADQEQVGHTDEGRIITPVNQILTPYGRMIDLPGMRPQAVALSPDGSRLITAGKTSELIAIDPATGEIRQRVPLPGEEPSNAAQAPVSPQILKPDEEGQLSFTGLIFSPSGDRIYMSNVDGSVKVFEVSPTTDIMPMKAWKLPPANAPRREAEIPSGLAVAKDGSKLYVCGNLSNRLLELDTQTGHTLRTFDVGVAPYDVVLVGRKAYVSNWGGRRPGPGDLTGPAGRGTLVRVDPVKHIASEGSVSVIHLDDGTVHAELLTGLHASGLAASPAHPFLVCCNAGSDHLSVIDTSSDMVVAKIWAKPNAADLLGAAPNAASFDASGKRLNVANGSQNAVAVFEFDAGTPNRSRLLGMIPVGWYPGALLVDSARNSLVVANIKGMPRTPKPFKDQSAKGFNSHHYFGSLSLFPIPSVDLLPPLSERVARNLRSSRIAEALLPPRRDQPARAIPQRIGEPSLIQHVVYIIKENRTFDQVFGAFGRGNGDPSLCIFGRAVTPNQHKIAEQFVLLDNTYCSGILSADGHQWSTTAYSTDYLEKSFAGFPRSYPDGMGIDEMDALSYAPSGFLWDNAIHHGKSLRNYGEFMGPAVRWRDATKSEPPDFMACYQAWKNRTNDVIFECIPSVESMRPFSPTGYVGWEMSVPDQFRADFILQELAEFEKKGDFPQLVIICLPNDHTSGTSPRCPTPAACVADNDLAFGRIVAGLSRSRFWPQMAIFAIEDDPQAGWDHVSGYRTIAFCVSPYTKRREIISTQYNTTSIIRTIEQILGMRPMNQFDASATPMFDCFIDEPDLTPYEPLPAAIALDQLNPDTTAITDPVLRKDAAVSASLNFRQIDRAPEDVLNRILWRAMRGSRIPYPEWAISSNLHDDDDDD